MTLNVKAHMKSSKLKCNSLRAQRSTYVSCTDLLVYNFARTATGEQTRSRVMLVRPRTPDGVPCPSDLTEHRTCPATGQCTSYAWHASYWSSHDGGGNDVKLITCQRSDGLVVYGMVSANAAIETFSPVSSHNNISISL